MRAIAQAKSDVATSTASPFAAQSVPLYGFLGATAVLTPFMLAARGLTIALDEFGLIFFLLAILVWFALCLRGRGLSRIATAIEAFALFYAICLIMLLISFICGTSHSPLADAWLAEVDRVILPRFDWPKAMLDFSKTGPALSLANITYQSIDWQPQMLILLLSIFGAFRTVWHFLLSWTITLILVMLVFTFFPAVGAYSHFGITAHQVPGMLDMTPWRQPEILNGLRDGTLHFIDLAVLDGIVEFPSFHTGAAVLLGYAFWDIRLLRWPFAILNLLMIASAVPIGGHYVVDIIAGAIVAVAGILIAAWILDKLAMSTEVASPPSGPREEIGLTS